MGYDEWKNNTPEDEQHERDFDHMRKSLREDAAIDRMDEERDNEGR